MALPKTKPDVKQQTGGNACQESWVAPTKFSQSHTFDDGVLAQTQRFASEPLCATKLAALLPHPSLRNKIHTARGALHAAKPDRLWPHFDAKINYDRGCLAC